MRGKISPENLLVGIDIGTTKICVLVAQVTPLNQIDIISIGKSSSQGLSGGVIVNIAQAVQAIKAAINEAQIMLGSKIESAYIGISGSHIQAFNSQGMTPVKKGSISFAEVAAAINSAKAVPLKEGHRILHVLPQYFVIDGNQKVADPLGMHGVRLEVVVHIITGAITAIQNLVRCCELAGVKVKDIVLEPIASALAVLSADEQSLGVGMLDIGGGTSDFAIYQNGALRHTKVIPIAGNIITSDIALCLQATLKSAQDAKHEIFGKKPSDIIMLESAQGGTFKQVYVSDIYEVIEARTSEIIFMLKSDIDKNHLHSLMGAGLVLTGGGSLISGLDILASDILNVPVRVGKPFIESEFATALDSPIYATSYGLLKYILKNKMGGNLDYLTEPLITRIFWRMKSWLNDFL